MDEFKKQKVIEFFKSIQHLKDFDKLPLPKFVAKELGIDIDTPKTISAMDAVKTCLNKVSVETYTNHVVDEIQTPLDIEFPAIPAKHYSEDVPEPPLPSLPATTDHPDVEIALSIEPMEGQEDEHEDHEDQTHEEQSQTQKQTQTQNLVIPFVTEGLCPLRGIPQNHENEVQTERVLVR
jgi:hypothetical protein